MTARAKRRREARVYGLLSIPAVLTMRAFRIDKIRRECVISMYRSDASSEDILEVNHERYLRRVSRLSPPPVLDDNIIRAGP